MVAFTYFLGDVHNKVLYSEGSSTRGPNPSPSTIQYGRYKHLFSLPSGLNNFLKYSDTVADRCFRSFRKDLSNTRKKSPSN